MIRDFPPLLPTGNAPLNSMAALQGEVLPPEGASPFLNPSGGMNDPMGGNGSFGTNGPAMMQPAMAPGSSRLYDASGHEIGQLQSWARADMDRWSLRNERFEQDQDQYRLAPPEQMPRNANNLVTLSDPRTLVDKITRIVARHPNIIEVPPAPGADPQIAQKMENLLYEIDRAINQRWIASLNNPYRYDQAFSAVLRGWIVERTMFDPSGVRDLKGDPSALWDHQIIEPACVYPYKAGGRIRRITHAYSTSVGDLTRDPLLQPFLDPDWYEQDERSLCHVTAIYWQAADGGWYHAIIGGTGPGSGLAGNSGLWIKQPTELGYNPFTIVLCGGAGYRETPWDDQEFVTDVGTGVLTSNRDNQKMQNRMVTRLNELLAQESNPAVSIFSNSGDVKKIDMTAGGRNFFLKDDKVELHRMGPEIRDFQLLWDIFRERASRGGLPEAFFGVMQSDNAFLNTTMMSAGKDILFPIAEGVNAADALKYRKMLELYRDFGPGIPLPTRVTAGNGMTAGLGQFSQLIAGQMGQATQDMMPGLGGMMGQPGMQPGMMGGMGQMGQPGMGQPPTPASPFGQVMLATVDIWEIEAQGCYVDITREDMTPQEIAARINLALGMVDKQIISRETARKEYVKLRNPGQENVRILSESVYQSPDIVKLLIPLTLTDTGQHFLRQLWDMTQNMVPPGGAPGQAPAPGSSQGSPGGQQANPGFNGSLPTQVTPPAAAGGQFPNNRVEQVDPTAALMNQLLGMMNGGAQGGTGAGGIPPSPGSQPVPQTPPPGQQAPFFG